MLNSSIDSALVRISRSFRNTGIRRQTVAAATSEAVDLFHILDAKGFIEILDLRSSLTNVDRFFIQFDYKGV